MKYPCRCDKPSNLKIGKGVFINIDCVFLCKDETIEIGDFCLIGPGVHIYTSGHTLDKKRDITKAPVKIGKGVWIGGGSIILPGVTIGDRASVGAGSVVTKNVPEDALVYGNPARKRSPRNSIPP